MTVVYPVETFWVEVSDEYLTIKGFHKPSSGNDQPVVILTMPVSVGKKLTFLLRKLVPTWEAAHGVIKFPPKFYEATGTAPEDWPPLPPQLG